MRAFRILILLGIVWAIDPCVARDQPPRLRQDLGPALQTLLCKSDGEAAVPSQRAIWQHGIYDAQTEIYLFRPKDYPKFSPKDLSAVALKLAQNNAHHGYAYGRCHAKLFWIVTTPAPRSFLLSDGDLQLSDRYLAEFCESYRVDYAAATLARPRLILKSKVMRAKHKDFDKFVVNESFLERGTLSLSCKPKQAWLGPMVWFLLPVKEGPLSEPMKGSLLSSEPKKLESTLALWTNAIRKDFGAEPLQKTERLSALTGDLISKNKGIQHQRHLLRELSGKLEQQQAKFIGENRVLAQNSLEAAWLLWNSPRHRSLLIHSNATHLETMAAANQGNQSLAVMVFARFF